MWKSGSRILQSDLRAHSLSFLAGTEQLIMPSKVAAQCSWIHSGVVRILANPMNLGGISTGAKHRPLLINPGAGSIVPYRSFTHCDAVSGEKQTDQEVVKRYYRLRWGGWLRRFPAAHKAMWKMNAQGRYNKDMHYFVSERNSKKFERMVRREYRMPHYFVDDPYEPYQIRTGSRFWYRSDMEETLDKITFPELSAESLAKRARMMELSQSQSNMNKTS